ncbi:GlxA family transcriptional regulator [Rhodovibrio salinarum]|uniref:GlxA family transcriptional regulator n=1 Tax=Rhodovibrio salinarum TaxID=1087 RepID=A0A934QEF3_9PROT|nr:GlxA family transcriptional regulator [Rhodovibrio salinarum]MBK1695768.1 GlxA family transcriptional regulator [Rhodovibrio salinarum]
MFARDPTDGRRHFGFLLLPGFSTLCLANSVEPLRAANEIAGAQRYVHRLLSLDGAPVSSSSGIEVTVDAPLDEAGRLDVFFLVAGYGFRDVPHAQLMPALRRAAGLSDVVGGMDTAPWLLAAAGLLDGRTATIHWQEQERLQTDFPEVTFSRARYVIDGNRITCGGATTVLDMMLGLLRAHGGDVLALDIMRLFIYDAERPAEGEQQALVQAPFVGRAPIVAAAIAEMEQAIETPRPVAEIAAASGCSQRKLERAFERALGVTPQRYYQYLRLAAGRRMLMDGAHSVTMVAAATGFASATSFARAYRRMFGHAPKQEQFPGSHLSA